MRKVIKYTLIILASLIIINTFFPNKSLLAAETSGITDGIIYNIVNKASGKNLNVNLGTDANGTNVIQWTNDGSQEQKFRVVYYSTMGSTTVDAYKIYAMCSSKGSSRVVDVLRTGGVSTGAISSGCNVDIWATSVNKVDYDCQLWKIQKESDGYFSIRLRCNTNLALTSIGTANGSGAGNTSTSVGNVIVSTWTGSNNQRWSFGLSSPIGTPAHPYKNTKGITNRTYYIDSTASNYSNFINNGVGSWSPTITFVQTSSNTADVRFYAKDFSQFPAPYQTSWAAVTWDYNSSNTNIDSDIESWVYAKIEINSNSGAFPSSNLNNNQRNGCIAHELGHSFGLKHFPAPDGTISIMYPTINASGVPTTPQTIDRYGITNKY